LGGAAASPPGSPEREAEIAAEEQHLVTKMSLQRSLSFERKQMQAQQMQAQPQQMQAQPQQQAVPPPKGAPAMAPNPGVPAQVPRALPPKAR
jgi:hypothetical protein